MLSAEQKRSFYDAGYLVVPGAISTTLTNAARRLINLNLGAAKEAVLNKGTSSSVRNHVRGEGQGPNSLDESRRALRRLAVQPEILDLFNKTAALSLVEELFGCSVEAIQFGQVAVNFPSQPPGDFIGQPGWPDRLVPFYGANLHIDGCWSGGSEPPQNHKCSSAWYNHLGTNGEKMTNEVRDGTEINIRNPFSLLVGIPLSPQLDEGMGNLAVLSGAHHACEAVFQQQRELGSASAFGPGGVGWPREDAGSLTGHGLHMIPPKVRREFAQLDGSVGSNGEWPRPTPVRTKPGDVVLVHYITPHAPTRVEGPDPRYMVYFRLKHRY
jgi:hypothetical protein